MAFLGQDPPPGNMVVGKTQPLNLEASVPHGLLAVAHASPRDRSSSPSGHVCRRSSSSCRWHVTGFPHFVSSKHVTGSSPHSRGGRHTRTYTPRGRTPRNHPRRLPTTLSCEDSSKGIHCRGGAPWLQSASFHSPAGPFCGREESIHGDKVAIRGLSNTHSSSPRLTPLSAALSANSREK